jgi:hypothetical protein
MLSSCNDNQTDPNTATDPINLTGPSDETVPTVLTDSLGNNLNDRANYKDNLPGDLDFNQAEYRVLIRDEEDYKENEFVDAPGSEVISDALYSRQQQVEDRLNIKIIPVKKPGDWGHRDEFISAVRDSVFAGTDDFDMIAGYAYYITPLALDGNFVNLAAFPYIDYENPWWPESIKNELIIDNKLYFITGDYSLSLTKRAQCLFFNKTIAEDYALPNLYQLVLNNEWTLDKFAEISKSVSSDLNGDGIYDTADLYGFIHLKVDVYHQVLQLPLAEVDDNGDLSIAIYNEKFLNAYSKLYEILHAQSTLATNLRNSTDDYGLTLFKNNYSLMRGGRMDISQSLKDMESDYGILPFPKYDQSQDKYYTTSADDYSLLCVPVTVNSDKYAMIGAATEAIAAEGYRTVTPAYFDIALKNKYSRDDESSQMLDIIAEGNSFQPALIYSGSLGNIAHLITGLEKDIVDISSDYQTKLNGYEAAFANFNAVFAELE